MTKSRLGHKEASFWDVGSVASNDDSISFWNYRNMSASFRENNSISTSFFVRSAFGSSSFNSPNSTSATIPTGIELLSI
ncbi:MAG: hypothetical protein ACI8VZ_002558 [Candidatus Paceibacteria bacterium]|jgi:hypothetical protein